MEKVLKGYTPEVYLKKKKSDLPRVQFNNADSAYAFVKNLYSDDIGIYESMFMVMLNRRNSTIGYAKISQGGIHGTHVDTRMVAVYALQSLCSGVILVHNHPSGHLYPSTDDIKITKDIKSTLSLFDCHLIDHLILSEDGYYSFSNEGII